MNILTSALIPAGQWEESSEQAATMSGTAARLAPLAFHQVSLTPPLHCVPAVTVQVPGPPRYPLLGNVLGYTAPGVGRDPSQSARIWQHLHSQHGPLVRLEIPAQPPTLLVFDPALAEQVQDTESLS